MPQKHQLWAQELESKAVLLSRQAGHLQTSSKAQPTVSRRADRMPGLSCDIMQNILTATLNSLSLSHARSLARALIHTRVQREKDARTESALNYDSIKSHWVKVVYSRNIHNWYWRCLLVRSKEWENNFLLCRLALFLRILSVMYQFKQTP